MLRLDYCCFMRLCRLAINDRNSLQCLVASVVLCGSAVVPPNVSAQEFLVFSS